jgi:UDP-4-amino-4,6-dideoxy-N-acetyl-beta-L-altrosamine transaminase
MSAPAFLPYGRQWIDDDDVAAVTAALRADYLTTGPAVERFEADFARAAGASHAVACNSGTAALHLAALGLDLGPGDAAIVPSLTFLATANVVRMTGAEVVFADVDPHTGLMEPAHFEAALARARRGRVSAAFPVHLNGQLCDMPGLAAIAARAGVALVEDACHALGAPDVGANAHSAFACFSTHPVKAIAMGEGGVVTTADARAAARLRRLRSHGMERDASAWTDRAAGFDGAEPNPWYYEMAEPGWNYRAPDLLCALGSSQLAKLERFMARRRALAAFYDRELAALAPVLRPVPHGGRPHGWHLYATLIDFGALGISRRAVVAALRARGVGTMVHYIPVHRQPYYTALYGRADLPGADAYYENCLSIPFYPAMTDADATRVVAALRAICAR